MARTLPLLVLAAGALLASAEHGLRQRDVKVQHYRQLTNVDVETGGVSPVITQYADGRKKYRWVDFGRAMWRWLIKNGRPTPSPAPVKPSAKPAKRSPKPAPSHSRRPAPSLVPGASASASPAAHSDRPAPSLIPGASASASPAAAPASATPTPSVTPSGSTTRSVSPLPMPAIIADMGSATSPMFPDSLSVVFYFRLPVRLYQMVDTDEVISEEGMAMLAAATTFQSSACSLGSAPGRYTQKDAGGMYAYSIATTCFGYTFTGTDPAVQVRLALPGYVPLDVVVHASGTTATVASA